MMFTVAIVGPDGAGKSTLLENLKEQLQLPNRIIYMGVNPEATTHSSPTWRLSLWLKRTIKGSATEAKQQTPPSEPKTKKSQNPFMSILRGLKSTVFITNWMSEQWYRQLVSWYYNRRGYLVLFDRHFYIDYLADRVLNPNRNLPRSQRFNNFVLLHIYPRPHLVIYLDAPSDILFARKGESSPEELERKRQAYIGMAESIPHFEIVDATLPSQEVAEQTKEKIIHYYKTYVQHS